MTQTDLDNHIPVVYVIGWNERGPVKVGITSQIGIRLSALQSASPFHLSVYGVRWVAAPATPSRSSLAQCFRRGAGAIEGAVHKKLKSLDVHIKGEWFDISARDAIKAVERVSEVEGMRAVGLEKLAGADLSGRADAKMIKMHETLLGEAVAIHQYLSRLNEVRP